MISRLVGEIVLKHPPDLIIDINGIGYEMQAPMSTFYKLPEVGEKTTLLTHLLVRDDAHLLYAFSSERDRSLFRALIRISGIGAKIALAILSGMEAGSFRNCVLEGDTVSLARIPGIGQKTAERLVLEMKTRFKDDCWMQGDGVSGSGSGRPPAEDHSAAAAQALRSLGYKLADARRMVRQVEKPGDSVEQIIRAALKVSLGGG